MAGSGRIGMSTDLVITSLASGIHGFVF